MNLESTIARRQIIRLTRLYLIGCIGFGLMALASIAFGYGVIRYHDRLGWPLPWSLFALGGVLLLVEMIRSARFGRKLPENFRAVSRSECPALFELIDQVAARLKIDPPGKVWLSPDAVAAVFIQPRWINLLFRPKRQLVFGLGFLTQMDDDEIRAVLYHEFGHYTQQAMRSSVSVYSIGQFARSFAAIREPQKQGTWEILLRSQLLLFTLFTIRICRQIDRFYARPARQMEDDADEVARRYVGGTILQRALLHAACIHYNYDYLQWGIELLRQRGVSVDRPYQALEQLEQLIIPPRQALSREILRRVERLGPLRPLDPETGPAATCHIRMEILRLLASSPLSGLNRCQADRFATWLAEGFPRYLRKREAETAVALVIHLDPNRHRLPWFDASYTILLDGTAIGTGNFRKGYTIRRRTASGKHRLTVHAPSGVRSRPLDFEAVAGRCYRIEMDYSVSLKESLYDVFASSVIESVP